MPIDPLSPSAERLRTNIAGLLKTRQLPPRDLAKAVGRSGTWIFQLLRGERSVPLDVLDQIARFFDVAPGRLLEDWTPATSHEEAPSHVVPASYLAQRQEAVIDRVLGLSFLLERLASERNVLEFIEANVRTLIEDAKTIRAARDLRADHFRTRSDRKSAPKQRTGSRSTLAAGS